MVIILPPKKLVGKNVSESPLPPPPPLSVVFRTGVISGGSRICEKGGPGIQIPRCRARPEEVDQRRGVRGKGGGDSDTFFPQNIFWRHLHYGVGVPSAYQTDLRGKKQIKNRPKKGAAGSPPPLWICHWAQCSARHFARIVEALLALRNRPKKGAAGSPPPPPPPLPHWIRHWAQCSARHFARIVEALLALLTWCGVVWYGNGSGVAGCSWWGDSTCCGIGWGWM